MNSYTEQQGDFEEYGQLERSVSARQSGDRDLRSPSTDCYLPLAPKASSTGCNSNINTCERPLDTSSSSPSSTQSTETLRSLNDFSTETHASGVSAANVNFPPANHLGKTFLSNANRSRYLSNGFTDVHQREDHSQCQYDTKRPGSFEMPRDATGGVEHDNWKVVAGSPLWNENGGFERPELLGNAPETISYTLESVAGLQVNSYLAVSSHEGLPHIRHPLHQENFTYIPPSEPRGVELWPSICHECSDPNMFYENLDTWSTHLSTTKHLGIWPSICHMCRDSGNVYENLSVWLAHAWTQHSDTNSWLPCKCRWLDPPCSMQKVFKTHKLWLDHVNGVHQKRFWCTVSNCEKRQGGPRASAFGTASYLKRHREAKHQVPVHCDKPFCSGRNPKLNRADKRDDHATKWHGPISCDYDGCSRRRIEGNDYGFSSQEELEDHLRMGKHSPIKKRKSQEKKA